MQLKDVINSLGKRSIALAKQIAVGEGVVWEDGICHVFSFLVNHPTQIPNVGSPKDEDKAAAIRKWFKQYKSAYDNRASVRASKLPGTVSDPILDKIIKARLTHLTDKDLKNIKFAHRLEMSAENILGSFLEEFVAINIKRTGWHCCWGQTVKAVDFVHESGMSIQVKNRDNSENSSSSAIRTGTDIQKWFRIRSKQTVYMWDILNGVCGTKHMSETAFEKFVVDCVTKNPSSLVVEEENPWKDKD